jgi:hypothetical protein
VPAFISGRFVLSIFVSSIGQCGRVNHFIQFVRIYRSQRGNTRGLIIKVARLSAGWLFEQSASCFGGGLGIIRGSQSALSRLREDTSLKLIQTFRDHSGWLSLADSSVFRLGCGFPALASSQFFRRVWNHGNLRGVRIWVSHILIKVFAPLPKQRNGSRRSMRGPGPHPSPLRYLPASKPVRQPLNLGGSQTKICCDSYLRHFSAAGVRLRSRRAGVTK